MIRQTIHTELLKRLKEKRRFVQVLQAPGKWARPR